MDDPSTQVYLTLTPQTLIGWEQGMVAHAPILDRSGLERARFFAAFGAHETRIQTETPGMGYPEVWVGGQL
jgi:hypothetical protein